MPLLPFLPLKSRFIEPCAANGKLIAHLELHGHKCIQALDIKPLRSKWHGVIQQRDVLNEYWRPRRCDYIITNPPYTRDIMHAMILKFSDIAPTWLLFDADWYQTKQAIPYYNRLVCMVAVGRIKWFENTKATGKENYTWYLFDKPRKNRVHKSYGRT